MEGVKVVHLRIQVLKNERQEVRVGVDLELYIRREGEVGRSAAKLCRDELVKPARGGCKGSRPSDGKLGYAWDDDGKVTPMLRKGVTSVRNTHRARK